MTGPVGDKIVKIFGDVAQVRSCIILVRVVDGYVYVLQLQPVHPPPTHTPFFVLVLKVIKLLIVGAVL